MKKSISIDNSKLTVTIKVSPIDLDKKKIKYMTTDVIEELEKEGYVIKSVLVPSMVTNANPSDYVGTWVFLLDPLFWPRREKIIVSEKQMEKIIETIENPSEPNEELKKLMKEGKIKIKKEKKEKVE
jgi:hypothetical protein